MQNHQPCTLYALANSPSIEPDSPRVTTVRGERPVRRLERPKEEGIIRMTRPLHGDIASPVPSKRPCHIWKIPRHLKVYENIVMVRHGCQIRTYNPAILDCNRLLAFRDTPEARYPAPDRLETGPVRA